MRDIGPLFALAAGRDGNSEPLNPGIPEDISSRAQDMIANTSDGKWSHERGRLGAKIERIGEYS
jgi:hypothetical protein